jgi:tripartite-type tricarboxylate transporter receptor subunit TctC
MGQANVTADPRQFNWLGATSLPSRVCVAWGTSPVRTPADLFTHELIVAGSGAGSSLSILPTVFNHVLGTKFRVIEGYKGTTDAVLAMERGEVQGVCATYGQFRIYDQLLREGKLRFILRAEEAAIPELAQVPSIFDFAKTDDQRRLMRFDPMRCRRAPPRSAWTNCARPSPRPCTTPSSSPRRRGSSST